MYHRVMLTLKTEDGLVNAWTYVINDGKYTGKRLSLNEDGLVKWTKTKSGYIEPKGHALASEKLAKEGVASLPIKQDLSNQSAKSCRAY